MPNLHRFLAGIPWLEALVTIAVILAIGFVARTSDWKLGAVAALAGGLLVGRHSYVADCSLLLPAAAILSERLPAKRAWLVLILSPIVYWPAFLGYPLPTVLAICGVLGLAVLSAGPPGASHFGRALLSAQVTRREVLSALPARQNFARVPKLARCD